MLFLTLLALAQNGQGVQIAERIQLGALGPELVREFRSGGQVLAQARGGRMDLITAPRWVDPDNGLAWICNDVSVGTDGAVVMAGKWLNNQRMTLYSQGSSTALWDFLAPGSESPQVAVAEHDGLCAGMTVVDMDPSSNYDYEATVSVFDTAGGGTPAWQYVFPRTLNFFGGGVEVSDDGNVVLAVKADPNLQKLRVEAFTRNGVPISSGQVSTTSSGFTYFHSRQTRLSDDGRRAYFNVGTKGVIYDVASASVLYEHEIFGSFDAHALSGDGRSFAFGFFGYFQVWTESSPGVWTQSAFLSTPGSTYVGWVDLDADGSRCAYTVQRYSPAYDHIETGLYDVPTQTDLWRRNLDAPGTIFQLVTSGVDVDDAGETVAGASWGDALNATPEAYVYDAAGNLVTSIDARGSAFAVSLDGAGHVAAFGTKGVHANTFGNGGDVIVADPEVQDLHIAGVPTLGAVINVMVAQTGSSVQLGAATALGNSATPFGPSELDFSTLIVNAGPIAIPGGGLNLAYTLPVGPSFAGLVVHVQGGILGGVGGGHLTNRVSVQLVP